MFFKMYKYSYRILNMNTDIKTSLETFNVLTSYCASRIYNYNLLKVLMEYSYLLELFDGRQKKPLSETIV